MLIEVEDLHPDIWSSHAIFASDYVVVDEIVSWSMQLCIAEDTQCICVVVM